MAGESKTIRGDTGKQRAVLERVNQQVMAWLVGMSVREFRDRSDLPRNGDGSYNARDVVLKLFDTDGGEPTDRARKERAIADLKEMERDKQAGRLIPVEVARERLGRMVESLKGAIAVLGDREREVIAAALDQGLAEW